jgi:hypothetical protein
MVQGRDRVLTLLPVLVLFLAGSELGEDGARESTRQEHRPSAVGGCGDWADGGGGVLTEFEFLTTAVYYNFHNGQTTQLHGEHIA